MSSAGSNPQHSRAPRAVRPFRETALASGLVTAASLDAAEAELHSRKAATDAGHDRALADLLVAQGLLTPFQAEQMLAGRRKLTLGQYRILDAIGQGGMGRVFRAEHVMMGREVAIKVLPREKSTPDTEAAFRREIRMLGRLDHDNLVRALDAGHDGKVYYLVTELIDGVDLRKQVRRYGVIDEVAAASVITQAARGLAYAHDKGLVHRDVKPGNLLVSPDGRVKVLDLGLAGSVFEGESMRLGKLVGTIDYMAPEQIRAPDKAGPAADIYGLGCTLYYALVGDVPFPGGTREEKARRHLAESPPPVQRFAPQVSTAFCRVIEAMLQKDPDERLASAAAVIDRLKPWTPDIPLPMPRQPVPPRGSGRIARPEAVLAGRPPAQETSRVSSASHDTGRSSPPDPLAADDAGGSATQTGGGFFRRLLSGIRRAVQA